MPTLTVPSVPGFDFSKLDLSKLQLPKFDLPKFDLPKVDLPTVDVDRLGDVARDAAYVGVGLVALTAQKLAERRREIQAEITTRARQMADAIA